MSRFVIFSNSKKSNMSNPTVFCGWGKLSEVGSSRAEPKEPGPAHARPSGWYFQYHGPKPDQVCEAPIPRDVGPARHGPRVSNLTGRLPGLAREILRIFSLFLRAGVSPWPKGFEAATCLLSRAPRLLWGVARSLQPAYEEESYTGDRIP